MKVTSPSEHLILQAVKREVIGLSSHLSGSSSTKFTSHGFDGIPVERARCPWKHHFFLDLDMGFVDGFEFRNGLSQALLVSFAQQARFHPNFVQLLDLGMQFV